MMMKGNGGKHTMQNHECVRKFLFQFKYDRAAGEDKHHNCLEERVEVKKSVWGVTSLGSM